MASVQSLKQFYENLAVSGDITYYLNPVGRARRQNILRLLEPRSSDRVLDLGCGDGHISKFLVGKVREVKGLDISIRRIERAVGNGIDARHGDASATPYPGGYFDKIICSELIEHVPQPEKALNEIGRLLRPGGIAVLSVPLQDKAGYPTLMDVPNQDLVRLSYEQIKAKYRVRDDHVAFFSEESFVSLLRSKGFIVLDRAYTYGQELRSARYGALVTLLFRAIRTIGNPEFFARFISFCYRATPTKHHLVAKVEKPVGHRNAL